METMAVVSGMNSTVLSLPVDENSRTLNFGGKTVATKLAHRV
jgi:hypothetical protein